MSILGKDRPNQDRSWEHTWENEGGSVWPDNGKKWSELTKEEKLESIKKQMKKTQDEEQVLDELQRHGQEFDEDNGC